MRVIRLFDGPIPTPPRLYVHGVDRVRESDREGLLQLCARTELLLRLSRIPGTPFTGRFLFIPE